MRIIKFLQQLKTLSTSIKRFGLHSPHRSSSDSEEEEMGVPLWRCLLRGMRKKFILFTPEDIPQLDRKECIKVYKYYDEIDVKSLDEGVYVGIMKTDLKNRLNQL